MQPMLIKNDDHDDAAARRGLARVIYAETRASSLAAAEALASMIGNLRRKSMRRLGDIADDESVFESLNKNSARHAQLSVSENDPKFQMCLRVAKRMADGQLADSIRGATRFHRTENYPDWANSIGYAAEIDGLMFYL